MSKTGAIRGIVCAATLPLLASCGPQAGQGAPMGGVVNLETTPRGQFNEQDVWFEPPRVWGGGVWFAQELEPLGDAVAEVFARPEYGAYRVAPPPMMRGFLANAQAGRLPGLANVCQAPPPPALLAQSWFRGSSHGEIETRCKEGTCEMTVVLHRWTDDEKAGPDDTEMVRFGATLPANEAPVAWAARIRGGALRRLPAPSDEGGLGMLGALMGSDRAPGVYVTVSDLDMTGPWSSQIEDATFQPVAAALDACSASAGTWRDWWSNPFLVEVSTDGHIARCEYELPDHLPTPGFSCQCNVLRSVSLGAGQPGRRARFYLNLSTVEAPKPGARSQFWKRAYLQDTRSVDDPTAVLGTNEVSGEVLTACLDSMEAPMPETNVAVRFSVGPDGRVTAHEALFPQSFPPEVARCIDGVLGRASFNCPLSGKATVTGVVSVSVNKR